MTLFFILRKIPYGLGWTIFSGRTLTEIQQINGKMIDSKLNFKA
jgi:hypothetical protein